MKELSAMEETIQSGTDVTLRDYLDILRRRKAILIQTFVVVMCVGVVATFMSKPVYQSVSRILVEGKSFTVTQLDANNPLSNLFMPPTGHDVATQIEVLQSERVMKDTFEAANVSARGSVEVDVEQVGETDVIEITSSSQHKESAEKIAAQLPKTYLKYVTNNRKQEVEHALDFAKNRLIEERAALEAAEERFLRFKQRTNLASLEKEREERITQVFKWGDEIRQAEAKVKSERIKLANIEARRAALPPMVDSPSEAPNPVVKELGDKIASLREQRAGLLVLWKPGSAQIQAIDAQIGQMEARLKETPLTVTTVTRAPNAAIREYDEKSAMARGEAAAAAAILGDLRQAAASTAAGLGKYSALENLQSRFQREIEHRKSTVGMLGKSVGDLSLRVKATHDPVLTISAPSKAKQTSPRPMRNTVYAIVAGLVLGLCFALLQEYLDDRVNSPEDARRLMDVPVLGYVPLIENEGARLLTTTRGGGTVLESYRVLRSNVQFASVDATTSSILVTSTVPGEGKSITAANLSIAMALNGRQVILVDADLRRPTVHEKFGVEQRPGLTNVLVGHTTLEEALQTTHIEGLRILAAGPIPPNPAEILGSRSMRELHELLKQHADVIVYDSPPVLATADAQVLSAEVDGVIFVVQFGEAKKSGLRHVSELLGQARARVLGIVFNKIDLSGKRSDGYSGYYRYYNYYSSPQIEGEPRRKHSTDEFESLLPAPENGHMRADESGVPAPAVAEKGDS